MNEVEAYLAALSDDRRAALEHVRQVVRSACPDALEVFGYRMPGFKYRRRPLLYFAAFKDHLSLFAMGYEAIRRHRADLAGFDIRAGTIHFQPDRPLPDALLTTMIGERMADVQASLASRANRRQGA